MLWMAACQGHTPPTPEQRNAASNNAQGNQLANTPTSSTLKTEIKLTSSAFTEGSVIPRQYTCDGANISPQLLWDSVPDGTQTLILIAEDPDAPNGTWTHWIVFGIPASIRELPENMPPQRTLTGGIQQGINDFKKLGYGGPCPPAGQQHRYYFKLYALDMVMLFEEPPTRRQLLSGIEGHILAEGKLMGKYQRP
jgi:Raf kinase inhibitor-like YbhB/YbcL family protein